MLALLLFILNSSPILSKAKYKPSYPIVRIFLKKKYNGIIFVPQKEKRFSRLVYNHKEYKIVLFKSCSNSLVIGLVFVSVSVWHGHVYVEMCGGEIHLVMCQKFTFRRLVVSAAIESRIPQNTRNRILSDCVVELMSPFHSPNSTVQIHLSVFFSYPQARVRT